MKKRIYIITGAPNVRKSSAIRALTGIYHASVFDIGWNDVIVSTFIMPTSPNEITSVPYPNGISPDELIEMINQNAESDRVILPLRSVDPAHQLPLADIYITSLIQAGFEIASVVMFNDGIELPAGINGVLIQNTTNTPSNSLAQEIRAIWGLV